MLTTDISILLETLRNKQAILSQLLNLTEKQTMVLSNGHEQVDLDTFDHMIVEKDELINKVLTYDKGFDTIYKRINTELNFKKNLYRGEIKEMQSLIKIMTELSIKIKNAETLNKSLLEQHLGKERKVIQRVKKRNTITSAYGQSMRGQSYGESLFIDKKN